MSIIKLIVKFFISIGLFFLYIFYILPASLFKKSHRSSKNFIFERRPGGSYFFDRNLKYGKRDLEGM